MRKILASAFIFWSIIILSACDVLFFGSSGSVKITTSNNGAYKIIIDEHDTGKTAPATLTGIGTGWHTVSLSDEDDIVWGPKSFEVKKNAETEIAAEIVYQTGLTFLPTSQYLSIALSSPPVSGTNALPSSYDLTDYFPSPGNQKKLGSCAGWAVAYGLKSAQEKIEENWSFLSKAHVFSPSFVYNNVKESGGGAYLNKALDFLKEYGCASLEKMAYTLDPNQEPTQEAYEEARAYKISSWARADFQSASTLKSFLCNKTPVVIGMRVYPDFDKLNLLNPIYDNANGTLRGNHALVIIGYDDSKNAFKVINSWGKLWGVLGYGWIDYSTLAEVVNEAYVCTDMDNARSQCSIQFSSANYSVSEGGGHVAIQVTRTGGSEGAVSVVYTTDDDSADGFSDYVSTSGVLSWSDGDASPKTIQISITDDNLIEGAETFKMSLGNVTGTAAIGDIPTTTITITDNDRQLNNGELNFSSSTYSQSENGGNIIIGVTRTGGSDSAVSVRYTTLNGTATGGSDYVSNSGYLTWGDGDASTKYFAVTLLDDSTYEGNETFSVSISEPSNGAVVGTRSNATVTILENDQAPIVDNPPSFVGASLPPTIHRGTKPNFSGNITDDKGLAYLAMSFDGPGGFGLVFSQRPLSGTSISLSSYYFDSSISGSWGWNLGDYTVYLIATDSAGHDTTCSFTTRVVP